MKSMVVLLIVSFAAVGVLGGKHGGGHGRGGIMLETLKKCMEENGVSPEQMKAAKKSDENVDQNVKCVSSCIAKKLHFASEDGTLDKGKTLNVLLARVPEDQKEQTKEQVQQCFDLTGSDECDTAYQIWKCIRSKLKRGNEGGDSQDY